MPEYVNRCIRCGFELDPPKTICDDCKPLHEVDLEEEKYRKELVQEDVDRNIENIRSRTLR